MKRTRAALLRELRRTKRALRRMCIHDEPWAIRECACCRRRWPMENRNETHTPRCPARKETRR